MRIDHRTGLLLPFVSLLVQTTPAAGFDCVPYGTFLRWAEEADTPGDANGVAAFGDLLLVADMESGLQVMDFSNPDAPVIIGSLDTPGEARQVATSGTLAIVAAGIAGLQILSVADPSTPELLGSIDPGFALDVAVSGHLAYVANNDLGLAVIDFSDPASPILVGTLDTASYAAGITVEGDRAYIADFLGGLLIVDVSDPSAPALIASIPVPVAAYAVTVSGDYAYVASSSGLGIVDISEPAAPQFIRTLYLPEYVRSVAVSGSILLVGSWYSHPDDEGEQPIPAGGGGCAPPLYVGLTVLSLEDPADPQIVGQVPGYVRGIAIAGSDARVAAGEDGVRVVDFSNPASPRPLGCTATPQGAREVDLSNEYAFAACGDAGLVSIDATDPAALWVVDALTTTDTANDVAVNGDFAYVAARDAGLLIVDVSDPSDLQLAGSLATPSRAYAVEVRGDLAFVGATSTFRVYDVSIASSPSLIGAVPAESAVEIALDGDLAYVMGYHGMEIFDITDPASPVRLSSYHPTDYYVRDIALVGDHAYLATQWSGVKILDVTNPSFPLPVGQIQTWSPAEGIAASDGYLYVAIGQKGIDIFDLSNLEAPEFVGDLRMNDASEVVIENGLLWIPGEGLSTAGLMCAAASTPELAGSASTGSSSWLSPNPFSEHATIRFDLPRSSEVTLAIYDSAGRHVRQWTSASLPAGPQSLSLGTERQRALAPGTYFYSIHARGFQTAGKAVVVR